MTNKTTRRKFLRTNSALAGFFILPSGLRAEAPNSKLCTAHIGTAGKGATDTTQIAADPRTQVVGLCDVDLLRLEGKSDKKRKNKPPKQDFSGAKKFQDYREMLSELGDKIDAVSISTPDHTHYPATLAAMKLGKHVYTQKPLTNNIAEARHLLEVAREKKIVSQMGIQNKSSLAYRMATQFIRSGVVGKMQKVYVWSHKNWGHDGDPYPGEDQVPANLDWNLWLGTARELPFLEKKYHPGQWRRNIDFGCGTLGDMGVHIFDTPFDSLRLKPPTWVRTDCREPNNFSLPTKTKVTLGFEPSEYTTKDFEWHWHDGDHSPPSGPDLELPEGQNLPQQGAMFVGEEGRMLLGHCVGPRFFPKSIYDTLTKPDLPSSVNHYGIWIDAIHGDGPAPTANFEYASPMSETVLLGVVAGRFPGKKLEWDTAKGMVTNLPEANQFVEMKHRAF